MKRAGIVAKAAVFGLALSAAGAAQAVKLDFTGLTGVTGTAEFTFASVGGGSDSNGSEIWMTVTLTNTSPIASDLRGIFFNLPTSPSAVTWSGYFDGVEGPNTLAWYLYEAGAVPPFGSFDLCGQTEQLKPNQKCNAGISTSGLVAPPDASDFFIVGLKGLGTTAANYESAFTTLFSDTNKPNVCLRYQAISNSKNGQTSDKVCSDGSSVPDEPLPEPGTLVLLGLGLLGLGAARRRRLG